MHKDGQGSFQRLLTFPFCPATPADLHLLKCFFRPVKPEITQMKAQMLKKPSGKKRGLWISMLK